MTKAAIALLLVVCGLAHADGQTILMTPEQASQFEARLRGWANTYYPALVTDKKLPDGIVLGFILDRSGTVVEHTAGLKAEEDTTVRRHLAHLFPRHKEEQLRMAGGGCFGVRQGEPKYCVEYATADDSRR